MARTRPARGFCPRSKTVQIIRGCQADGLLARDYSRLALVPVLVLVLASWTAMVLMMVTVMVLVLVLVLVMVWCLLIAVTSA